MKNLLGICACVVIMPCYLQANDFHRYIWANYQQFSGNSQQAEKWYDLISEAPQQSVFTNKGYLHFLHDHGNHTRIVQLMPKLEETFKNDPDIQLIFVLALRKAGKIQEADDKLLRLSHSFKLHPEIVFQATETLVRRKETKNALSLIDDYLNSSPRRPNNFIFYYLKAQIYMDLKEFQQARSQIQQCLEVHPHFPQGWLLLAMVEEQSGQIEQAIKGYNSYLEIIGPNQQIQRHLLELVFKQKATQRNQQIMFISKSCITKALLLFERKQYPAALKEVNTCLAHDQNNVNARVVTLQILTAMNAVDEAIATISSWIAQEPDNTTWYQAMNLLPHAQVPLIKIINALSTIHKQHPGKLLPALYLADLHTREGNNDEAITYHTKALKLSDNQLQLKTRILYQLSVIYYEKGDYKTMLSHLEQIETSNVAYPPAHNLHAYYYATKGNNLEKAQQLLTKAQSNDKNNPHFLDTQAKIFYKQKKYEQARNLLQALSQKEQTDSTILINLAKTHNKLGQAKQACSIIDRAQQCAHTHYEKKKSAILAYRWNKPNQA